MELSRARDLHSVIKHSGGLNFSVGFTLEDFDLVDEKDLKPGQPWVIIKRGDLIEVSVVTFGACPTAQMDMKSRSFAPTPARAKAAADWEAFMSKARLDQFQLRMKLDQARRAIRKAKEREAFERTDWEGLRLRDPKASARAHYNL